MVPDSHFTVYPGEGRLRQIKALAGKERDNDRLDGYHALFSDYSPPHFTDARVLKFSLK